MPNKNSFFSCTLNCSDKDKHTSKHPWKTPLEETLEKKHITGAHKYIKAYSSGLEAVQKNKCGCKINSESIGDQGEDIWYLFDTVSFTASVAGAQWWWPT